MRFALTNVDMTPSTPAIEDSIKEIYQDYLQQCSVGDLPMLLYAHFGNFDHNQSELTLRTIEKVLADVHMKRSAIKHFCNLLIEVLQNISSHSALDLSGHSQSFLLVNSSENTERLVAGNLILASEIAPLQQHLESLSKLNPAELHKQYVETLCADSPSDKGGAGLGLIMIFRKLGESVKWRLNTLGGTFGYFVLDLHIRRD
ncbi:MAG: hypothetical protein JNM00_03080 [Flavobacteriales bacterium]|nr:hypothetical protein [Flavobacteriales bacterium]